VSFPGRLVFMATASTLLLFLHVRPAVAQGDPRTSNQTFAAAKARLVDLINDDKQKRDQNQLQADEDLLSAINRVVLWRLPEDASNRPGFLDSVRLHVNALSWLQELWQPVPRPQPEIADYLADRALDPAFASRLHEVLVTDPVLRNWAASLDNAAQSVRDREQTADMIRYKEFSPEEKQDLLRRNDVPGSLRALRQVVDEMFAGFEHDTVDQREAWTVLQRFLKDDIASQMESAVKERDRWREAAQGLREAFWHGAPEPATLDQAYEHLEVLSRTLRSSYDQLSQLALSPNETPMAFLQEAALSEYLDAEDQFDETVIKACNMPETDQDRAWALNALFGFRGALIDQFDARIAGRYVLAVDTLMGIAKDYLDARRWGPNPFGEAATQFDDSRTVKAINYLDQYEDELLQNGGAHPTLWAAVDVAKNGTLERQTGGWLEWTWLNNDDRNKLTAQNRLIRFAGHSWLLPEGITGGSITSLRDLLAARAQLVGVALDSQVLMADALRDHWIKYLKEIQTENNYPNWSGPPYDLYLKSQPH
jgi:hypothetical protein